jgi:hypothetical protein
MRKSLAAAVAAVMLVPAALMAGAPATGPAPKAQSPLPAKPAVSSKIKAEFFWAPLDQRPLQYYFLLDAVKRRLGSKFETSAIPLVSKKDGKFASPRGDSEINEAKRLAAIIKKWPAREWDYITGRTFNPAELGWKEAAAFAGIDPAKLEAEVSKNGEADLGEIYEATRALQTSGNQVMILFNGKPFDGEPTLLGMLSYANNMLSKDSRITVPVLAKYTGKPPRMYVVSSSTGAFGQSDKGMVDGIARALSGLTPEVVNVKYEDVASNAVFKDAEVSFLPFYAIEDTPDTEGVLKQYIDRGTFKKEGSLLVMQAVEEGMYVNRQREPGRLDMFVMAHCPYGVQAEKSIINAKNKNLLPPDLKIHIHYILTASKDQNGMPAYSSLHGMGEWEEDLRQLIIAKNHPDKFWAYLAARDDGDSYTSSLWEKAAVAAGIDPSEITGAFEQSKPMLDAEAALSDEMHVNSSPTFIYENNVVIGGINGLRKLAGFEKMEVSPVNGSCGK